MTLKSLLNIHGHLDWRSQAPEGVAKNLCTDSRQVQEGDVFVAIRGHSSDGHQFLSQVIQQKPSALVVEDKGAVPDSFQGAVVEVLDTRLSLQVLAQRFYSHPGDKMLALAVTGTNGKTSTAYLFEYLLNQQGKTCGVIGTIDHHVGAKLWKTQLTSPDPITLQKRLQEFLEAGADSFIIEASSHALHQNRIQQGFDAVLFTNLSRDHLDYQKDMQDYFQSKAKLFSSAYLKESGANVAVINGDDSYAQELKEMTEGRLTYLFGKESTNDFIFSIKNMALDGCDIHLIGPNSLSLKFHSPLIGEHNVYNVVGVLVALYALGMDLGKVIASLESFPGIPGRMQHLQSKDQVHVFVDYAHTPEALEKAIHALKEYLPEKSKITTVMGCGGDRDKGKRPLMGEVADKNSDKIVVTSDNPRSEDPQQIIDDILVGVKNTQADHFFTEVDRARAINFAIAQAQGGDVVLIAGKGHENYQILKDKTIDLSDFDQARAALEGRSRQ